MKKLTLLLFLLISNTLFSQYEYRFLPPLIEAEFHHNNSLHSIVRPKELPPADQFSKGPEKILTPAGFQIINIVNANGGQTETFITRHPFDPNVIVAAANDMRYNSPASGYRMASYYSTDG
ncbi:MAG: hypothetical protein ACK42Z_08780, partial [Candidatus Kapaibacteriota bacterium]